MALIGDFISTYWYIFVLIGVISFFLIYRKLDYGTKIQLKKIFNKKVIFVIIVIGVWYYWHKTGGTTVIRYSTFWMPILLLCLLVGYNFIGKLQYRSQQLITPNFHGSYAYARKIGAYYIFAIDGFTSDIFNWFWGSRIVIIREETVQFTEEGAISIARVGQTSIYAIENSLKEEIESNSYFKSGTKEIYFGWFDDLAHEDWKLSQLKELAELKRDRKNIYNMIKETLDVDNPKVSDLFFAYKNVNKLVNKQTEDYDATVESGEKWYEHNKRMKGKYEENYQPQKQPEEEI